MIVFRVDSSAMIGTGHVMRCLSLADEFRRVDKQVLFICRDLDGNVAERITERGYPVNVLQRPGADAAYSYETEYGKWLGVAQDKDLEDTVRAIGNNEPSVMIVDHYALNTIWESQVKRIFPKIKLLVIDDLANRQHYCDFLVDHNQYTNYEKRYDGLVPNQTVKLLGAQHALLSSDYNTARKRAKVRDKVRRILVVFGGYDAHAMVLRVCEALEILIESGIYFTLVLGSKHPRRADIYQKYRHHENVEILEFVSNMPEIMLKSDLAISASGVSTWERCLLGLPSVIVTVANNQIDIAQSAHALGIAEYCGSYDQVSNHEILSTVRCLINDPQQVALMSNQCFGFMSASGVTKVVESVLS